MYDNVNLWFAKDVNNNIVTIDEVNFKSKDNYYCPMCGSDLIPKAIKSHLITAHFAHIDASKCNGEGMVHFWFKNKFLEPGDVFTIASDKERQYICKEVLVEQSYSVGDKIYRPDVTLLTECGNTIYFEMDYSNKKKVQEYINIWLELRNIVVEVDIKKLMSRDKIPTFKALFYDGKCFNTKKNDMYYNTIGKYKEEVIGNVDKVDDDLKERIQKLDWFWDDVLRYKNNEVDIDYMVDLINVINKEDIDVIKIILNKTKCTNIYENYIKYKANCIFKEISYIAKEYYGEEWDNYLKCEVRYDYYPNKSYVGYISFLDVSDKCFCLIDITNRNIEDIKNIIIKGFDRNKLFLQDKKIKQEKESKQDYNIKLITQNHNFINIVNNLDKNYQIEVFYRWDTLEIILKYINSGVVAKRVYENNMKNTMLSEDINVNDIIKILDIDINNYLNNIEEFKYDNELINIIGSLKERYNKISNNISISGKRWLGDIYNIDIFSRNKVYINIHFYITNNGVLEDARKPNIIYKYKDSNDLEKFLINKISNEIRNEIYK